MEIVNSVHKSILAHDWTISIDLTCVPTCSDSSSIQRVSSVYVRSSGFSVYCLILWNVPKSMDFYQSDGRYSSAPVSACHLGISLPRRLAYKKSNSQTADISHKILPSNSTMSRFYSKSKEFRFDTSPEIHIYRDGISDSTEYSSHLYRDGISDSTEYSQGTTGLS